LAIPGVREPFVTDNAMSLCRDNGLIMYVMDMPKYDSSGNRLYDDSSTRPDPGKTSETFESRAIDNSYGAVFFPDVNIQDSVNNRVVKVPSSVVALGVLGFNDKVAFPWFAPAGFNRGALGFVTNVETRLSQGDKDTLYDARINPIATFPTGGFVVFGQKTLQQAKSALDRINVRRLLLELKRIIGGSAQQLLFEPNNAVTRARFVASVTPQLALVQAQSGVESFKVVCDDSNNSAEDVASNKLNGRIVIVPTRTIEFVSIDFIITNSGVQFL
jgi:phage tail sheath protein FI